MNAETCKCPVPRNWQNSNVCALCNGSINTDSPPPDIDKGSALAVAIERTTEFVGGVESNAADAAAVLVNVGDVRTILRALIKLAT